MRRHEPHERSRGAGGRRGFTLVELLVVVAVIALLLGMLVPSLGRARSYGRSVVCKSNLKQIWELFQDAGESMHLPAPRAWLEAVARHDADVLVRCPEDTFEAEAVTELALSDLYLVQDPGGLTFYPVTEIIQNPGTARSYFQLELLVRGPGLYEFWIDDDAACTISLGRSVVVTPLWAPGAPGCGSEHWVCHGPNIGTSNWRSDVIRRLTGRSYHTVEAPFTVTGFPCSYGMNVNVAPLDAAPGQLLLLDYCKLVADPVADTVGSEMEYLDLTRHLGRINAVFVSGEVRTLWPDEVTPSAPLWR